MAVWKKKERRYTGLLEGHKTAKDNLKKKGPTPKIR